MQIGMTRIADENIDMITPAEEDSRVWLIRIETLRDALDDRFSAAREAIGAMRRIVMARSGSGMSSVELNARDAVAALDSVGTGCARLRACADEIAVILGGCDETVTDLAAAREHAAAILSLCNDHCLSIQALAEQVGAGAEEIAGQGSINRRVTAKISRQMNRLMALLQLADAADQRLSHICLIDPMLHGDGGDTGSCLAGLIEAHVCELRDSICAATTEAMDATSSIGREVSVLRTETANRSKARIDAIAASLSRSLFVAGLVQSGVDPFSEAGTAVIARALEQVGRHDAAEGLQQTAAQLRAAINTAGTAIDTLLSDPSWHVGIGAAEDMRQLVDQVQMALDTLADETDGFARIIGNLSRTAARFDGVATEEDRSALAAFATSYTMDVEHEIHAAVVHRLRSSAPGSP